MRIDREHRVMNQRSENVGFHRMDRDDDSPRKVAFVVLFAARRFTLLGYAR